MVPARSAIVERPGDEVLADATLARDEHGQIDRGEAIDLLFQGIEAAGMDQLIPVGWPRRPMVASIRVVQRAQGVDQ